MMRLLVITVLFISTLLGQEFIAKNNLGNEVKASFNGVDLIVKSDNELASSKERSPSTKVVMVVIDGQNTKALLKVNSHYDQATKIWVEAYQNGTLVTQTAKVTADGVVINAGSIEVGE
jgi:hypothetical protein